MPGFVMTALAGVVGAALIAAMSPSRRSGWGWTMLVGLIGGVVSGVALFELGVGALGGLQTPFDRLDARALVAHAAGGALGGASLTVMFQVIRSMAFRPIRRAERRSQEHEGSV